MGRRGHHLYRRRYALAAGVAGLGLVSIASAQVAQNTDGGGKLLRLTLGQSLQYSDNIELEPGEAEDVLRSSTRLGLSYSDVTRTQSLQFSTAGAYEVDSDGESDLSDPFAQFAYLREGANARLSFSADYRRADLDDAFVPLTLGVIGDEVITSIAQIEGGVRTTANYALGFETGLQSPIGFRLDLSGNERRFSQSELTTLADTKNRQADALMTFRINPQITARLTASGRLFEADNDEQTERTETNYGVGVAFDITPVTSLDLSVSQSRVKTERVTTGIEETDGVAFAAGLNRDLPNGGINVDLTSRPTLSGRENTFRVNRDMTLRRDGRLAYGIGVTQTEGFSSEPLFSLAYDKSFKRSRFGVELDQTARTDEDTDAAVVFTRLAANYDAALTENITWSLRAGLNDVSSNSDIETIDRRSMTVGTNLIGQINDVSSWSLGANLSDVRNEIEAGEARERRYGLELSYRREVTRDWNMVAQYRHSSILNDTAEDRRSNSISLGLERTFDFRP